MLAPDYIFKFEEKVIIKNELPGTANIYTIKSYDADKKCYELMEKDGFFNENELHAFKICDDYDKDNMLKDGDFIFIPFKKDNKIYTIESNASYHGYQVLGIKGFFRHYDCKQVILLDKSPFSINDYVTIKGFKNLFKITDIDYENEQYLIKKLNTEGVSYWENKDRLIQSINEPIYSPGDRVLYKFKDDSTEYVIKEVFSESKYILINPADSSIYGCFEDEIELVNIEPAISLNEILKDYIGHKFYNPMLGYIELKDIHMQLEFLYGTTRFNINADGTDADGFLCIFPSKEERDWKKWAEYEQKRKFPKTWNDLVDTDQVSLNTDLYLNLEKKISEYDIETSSSIALFKIIQVIDKCYGGCITLNEWKNDKKLKFIVCPSIESEDRFDIRKTDKFSEFSHIAFRFPKYFNEFLSYPENIKLLKQYFKPLF